MRQASPWQSRIRRAALTTFTLTRTGALIVATEFDTKKEELDKTQTELDAAKDTVTKKQAELDEAKAADEAAKQKHEELVADIAAKQEEIDVKQKLLVDTRGRLNTAVVFVDQLQQDLANGKKRTLDASLKRIKKELQAMKKLPVPVRNAD